MDKCDVTSCEQEYCETDEGEPCGVWLEGSFPGETLSWDSLPLAAVIETQVYRADGHPSDKSSYRDQVLKPSESYGCTLG